MNLSRRLRYSLFVLGLFLGHLGHSQQTVGLFLNDSLSFHGYTLFTPNKTTYLIDNCGFIIQQWESNYTPGLSAYLLENGDLLRAGRFGNGINGAGSGGIVERFSWEGELLWSYTYSSADFRQHHDIEPLPNGNVLLLAWERIEREEAIAAGRNPALTGTEVWPDHIVEVEPLGETEGKIVWEWHVWDHLIQEIDNSKENFGVVKDHPELVNINAVSNPNPNTNADWIHGNRITYHPERDEIAISSRHLSEIWVIDHSTTTEEAAGHTGGQAGKGGDLLYRWGNPQIYGQGTEADRRFFGQHNIRWIPAGYPGAGQMMVFNNGVSTPSGTVSTVDIFAPPLAVDGSYIPANGSAFGPDELTWTYQDDSLSSSILSSAQSLPNGNVLICYGIDLRFREVTRSGERVWDYISPAGNTGPVAQGGMSFGSVFDCHRYAPDYPAFDGKTLTPGDPIELDPLPSTCQLFDTSVNTTSPIAAALALRQDLEQGLLLLDNPTGELWHLQISDLQGRVVHQQISREFEISLPVSPYPPGGYILSGWQSDQRSYWVRQFFNIK